MIELYRKPQITSHNFICCWGRCMCGPSPVGSVFLISLILGVSISGLVFLYPLIPFGLFLAEVIFCSILPLTLYMSIQCTDPGYLPKGFQLPKNHPLLKPYQPPSSRSSIAKTENNSSLLFPEKAQGSNSIQTSIKEISEKPKDNKSQKFQTYKDPVLQNFQFSTPSPLPSQIFSEYDRPTSLIKDCQSSQQALHSEHTLHSTLQNDKTSEEMGNDGSDGVGFPIEQFEFCQTCQIYQPPHTSHCDDCECCVVGFDHHCPAVNSCVGRRNNGLFSLFAIGSFLGSSIECVTMMVTLVYGCIKTNGSDYLNDHVIVLLGSMMLLFISLILLPFSIVSIASLWPSKNDYSKTKISFIKALRLLLRRLFVIPPSLVSSNALPSLPFCPTRCSKLCANQKQSSSSSSSSDNDKQKRIDMSERQMLNDETEGGNDVLVGLEDSNRNNGCESLDALSQQQVDDIYQMIDDLLVDQEDSQAFVNTTETKSLSASSRRRNRTQELPLIAEDTIPLAVN
eukprot:MONOS_159.1-p1 / transcript=MONOS_159.1 / gene=MONOS_159 / organism=Monocercomonoides_exilis_PA203 / gene_product=unspecified product / transcript_product=unspecified product / location=Mono_scaffold00003:58542-60447(-) / protein_length=509 / sequence_SO=supercontig / SO=protein_coding / is_pseudo=false